MLASEGSLVIEPRRARLRMPNILRLTRVLKGSTEKGPSLYETSGVGFMEVRLPNGAIKTVALLGRGRFEYGGTVYELDELEDRLWSAVSVSGK